MKLAFLFVCLIFYGLQSSAQDLKIPDKAVKVPDKEIRINIPLVGLITINSNSESLLEEYAVLISNHENKTCIASVEEKLIPKENDKDVIFRKN